MELVEVEAVEDRTRPEGGHAVIVLRGAGALPASARFRLQAVDAEAAPPEARALLERTHEPLGVRETEDGIALEIGPGLADTAFLVPGMALEITLVDAGLRGEFLWPAVTPLARPKRRNIMTRRAAAETPPAPAAAPPAPVAPSPAPAAERAPSADAQPSLAPSVPPEPELAPIETPPPRPVVVAPPQEPAAVEAAASEPPIEASTPIAQPAKTPAIVVARPSPTARAPAPQPARASPAPTSQPSLPSSAGGRPGLGSLAQRFSEWFSERFPVWASEWTPVRAVAVTIAALLGLQVVGLQLLGLRVAKRVDAPTVAAPKPPERASQPASLPGIYDVLATEPVSPRGIAAEGVSPARALQLAHTYQHGPEAGRDRDEAIYWLKRYVISTTGSENTRIALTQLGSAYARPAATGSLRPDKGPDMRRAIAAWELAAAMGDTVAMCFLATIHERGMGVPADPVAAAVWSGRASRSGTCSTAGPVNAAPPR